MTDRQLPERFLDGCAEMLTDRQPPAGALLVEALNGIDGVYCPLPEGVMVAFTTAQPAGAARAERGPPSALPETVRISTAPPRRSAASLGA